MLNISYTAVRIQTIPYFIDNSSRKRKKNRELLTKEINQKNPHIIIICVLESKKSDKNKEFTKKVFTQLPQYAVLQDEKIEDKTNSDYPYNMRLVIVYSTTNDFSNYIKKADSVNNYKSFVTIEVCGVPINIIAACLDATDNYQQEISKILDSNLIKEKHSIFIGDKIEIHQAASAVLFPEEYDENNTLSQAKNWMLYTLFYTNALILEENTPTEEVCSPAHRYLPQNAPMNFELVDNYLTFVIRNLNALKDTIDENVAIQYQQLIYGTCVKLEELTENTGRYMLARHHQLLDASCQKELKTLLLRLCRTWLERNKCSDQDFLNRQEELDHDLLSWYFCYAESHMKSILIDNKEHHQSRFHDTELAIQDTHFIIDHLFHLTGKIINFQMYYKLIWNACLDIINNMPNEEDKNLFMLNIFEKLLDAKNNCPDNLRIVLLKPFRIWLDEKGIPHPTYCHKYDNKKQLVIITRYNLFSSEASVMNNPTGNLKNGY